MRCRCAAAPASAGVVVPCRHDTRGTRHSADEDSRRRGLLGQGNQEAARRGAQSGGDPAEKQPITLVDGRPPGRSGADVVGAWLPLALGVKGGCECRAHGCWIGADGCGDRARHGRPARRAALAGARGRALGAGKYEAIRLVGAQLLGVAVCGARHSVRAANHRVHAPCPQPSVVMGFHAPIIGRMQESLRLTAPSASAAARWWNRQRAPRGPWRGDFGPFLAAVSPLRECRGSPPVQAGQY